MHRHLSIILRPLYLSHQMSNASIKPCNQEQSSALCVIMVNSLSQCVFAMSVRFLCDGVSMKALIFATQGGAVGNVDITRWIAGLRDGNPVGEYAEVQASFANKARATIVQGVVTDALTAVFLLNGNSFTSVIGKSLLLRFAKLFVTFNEVTMTLGSSVRKLVPQLQAMCSPSLTDTNLKAVVQNVMALSLKPRANLDWIVKTITDGCVGRCARC